MGNPTKANILFGKAVCYYAPEGEAPPADSVGEGVAWGGNWVRVGYTKTMLSALYEFDEGLLDVQEELTELDRFRIAEHLTLEVTLAELTSTYLGLGTSGTVTTTAPGSGQVGKDELTLGGEVEIDRYAWGFEGTYRNSSGTKFPVRVFVYIGQAKMNGALEFSKASYPGIPLQIKALPDTTKSVGNKLWKFQRVTAAAS